MKTFIPKATDIDRKWYVADLKGAVLGRAAVKIADILRGKNKPYFSPHLDCGDNVIVINARHVTVTGRKAESKKYYRHSGYPGGLRTRTYGQMIEKHPEKVIENAIKGMIPHNRLGRKVFKKLHVYADDFHPHRAQKPQALKLD
ncbi:MAG: 50S ribosomal protein L13 [candidate division Zixibacteria bacterium]